MGGYALLICRSQTEAIDLRRHLARLGVPGEVARPPRHERTESCGWAVRVSAAGGLGCASAAAAWCAAVPRAAGGLT